MNIVLGIGSSSNPEELQKIIEAGANEFFLGYVPKEWTDEYGWELSMNRRFTPDTQYTEKSKLADTVSLIRQSERKVYLTVNDHEYSPRQMKKILRILDDTSDIEFDGYIVSNIAMMLELQKRGFNRAIHLSIGGGCNNVETIQFFHDQFSNIERFILPRKLTLSEIGLIAEYAEKHKIKLEVFGMAACCVFNDEYCFTWHSPADSVFCRSPMVEYREIQPLLFKRNWKKEIFEEDIESYYRKHAQFRAKLSGLRTDHATNRSRRKQSAPSKKGIELMSHKIKCGLCSFNKFKEWGINAVKLPMRDKNAEITLSLVKLAKQVIEEPDASPSFCQNLLEDSFYCSGSNCYYDYPFPT